MTDVASTVPAELTAGDSWRWRFDDVSNAFPPSEGWVLTCRFHNDASAFVLVAQIVNGGYEVSDGATSTAARAPGAYAWAALLLRGDERVTAATGRVLIHPDPATATADIRSHAERVLDAIRAVIEGRATKDQESYSIAGRSLSRTPLGELLALERRYAARVASEASARDGASGASRTISVRFKRS